MKEETTGILSTIKRLISNDAVSVKIYIYWGVFTLVIFGLFGFFPVTKIFISNVKLLEEMYDSNKKLESKIEELKVAKEKIDIVGEDAKILDEFLPDDFLAQTYMVQMSLMAGESGYSLDKINFEKVSGSSVSMSLSLTGKGKVIDFIEKLESSGRITQVENVKISIGDRDDTLNLNVKSFIMVK